MNYLVSHHKGNGHESKTQRWEKENIHLRVLRMPIVFIALGMKNEGLVDGKRKPNLMKNQPSKAVILEGK